MVIEVAKKLSNVFLYQDDCLAVNDDGLFAEHFKNIYPSELKPNNTNISVNKSIFLDMTISFIVLSSHIGPTTNVMILTFKFQTIHI